MSIAESRRNSIKTLNQMSEKVINIEELAQDAHNFNRGTDEGQRLMEQSFSEVGAGRSILIDKNGNIIAGNKSQKAAMAAGIKRVRVVEATGDELIAVKRTDVDINSEKGRKMALLDNLTTQVNLLWDETELRAVGENIPDFNVGDFGLDLENLPTTTWPNSPTDTEPKEPSEHDDISGQVQSLYQIAIDCEDESEQERIYNELKDRYKCRVLTL